MSDLKKATTIATVVAVVEDLTQDWGLDVEALGAATRLAADLDFASVDIIQLCVALEQTFGRRLGFQDLLMKDGSYVGDLTLGQFAGFVDARLAHKELA
ncbi:MAG: acyl carrier protein [Comamonadaceae bacterium]|nr:acyl carrier protein [Comamonadaceae bacterium]